MTRVRAATWNVHGLRAGVDAVLRIVRAEELDLLLVQESGSRRRLQELGERLGWVVCADPWAFPRRRIRNAVLIRAGLVASVRSRLLRFEAPLLQPRGALVAQVDERWTFGSVHLGLSRQQRLQQARQLLAALDGTRGTVLIGGDLNAHPDDPATQALTERYPDVWPRAGEGEGLTMPAAEPTARIDYLFASSDVQVLGARIAARGASDHLMLVADLEVPD